VTDIELRNRAVMAFTLLTGARDGAIASPKLKHVDVLEGKVVQDAREVRTKFSKTFTTWFFPVGEDGSPDRCRLAGISHDREATWPSRPTVSGHGGRAGSVSPVPDGRPLARALVQCHAQRRPMQSLRSSHMTPRFSTKCAQPFTYRAKPAPCASCCRASYCGW